MNPLQRESRGRGEKSDGRYGEERQPDEGEPPTRREGAGVERKAESWSTSTQHG